MQSKSEIRQESCKSRLDEVWIVGEELKEIALCIAEKVRVIERQPATSIAEMAKNIRPSNTLPFRFMGSAMHLLQQPYWRQTCADCTSLKLMAKGFLCTGLHMAAA